ncbi:hypothetical protein E2C01_090496 [Portunus trituberculatus]|uniref:Uncharacterized protein n=1 Tax=Portunus trituberculatus TaxID=210409 RepID=A0A5B7JLJ1_PORTR|nr:hypothetical protein [Portunus trituberculatus]
MPRLEYPVTAAAVLTTEDTFVQLYNLMHGFNLISVPNSITTLLRVMRPGADCVTGQAP